MLEGRKPGEMLDSDSATVISVTHPEKPPTWSMSRCGMFPSSGSSEKPVGTPLTRVVTYPPPQSHSGSLGMNFAYFLNMTHRYP